MPLEVRERNIPGVGMRYEIDLDDQQTVMVLLHTNGRREIYCRDLEESDEFEPMFNLSDAQARTLGLFLVGAYYQPIATKFGQKSSSGRYVDWYAIDSGTPLDGVERGAVAFSEEFGVTLLAVERGDAVHSTVDDAFTFAAGDNLIVLGTDGRHNDFARFAYGG